MESNFPVGLVGCGRMGAAIGERILSSGRQLVAWNRTDDRVGPLLALGAKQAKHIEQVLTNCRVTVVCLTNAEAILAAFSNTILSTNLRDRRQIFNVSTVGSKMSMELERFFCDRGMHYVDVPVSGGPEGARSGTLAMLVGAITDTDRQSMELLDVLCSHQIMIGNNARAQMLKVLNNLCEAINLWGAAEAIALARSHGVGVDLVGEVLTTARGDSVYLRVLLDRLTGPRDYVSVPVAIRRKDLDLALDLAVEGNIDIPLTRRAAALFGDIAAVFGESVDQTECIRAPALLPSHMNGDKSIPG